MLIKSIATQTGNSSYEITFSHPSSESFTFGFSGDSFSILSFTGQDGKLYDNDGNFVFGYGSNQNVTLSGNIFEDYHNYFIEGRISNSNCSRNSGFIQSFYSDNLTFENTNLSFAGSSPDLVLGSGVLTGGSTSGTLHFSNGSFGEGVSFVVYSGDIEHEGYEIFNVQKQTLGEEGVFNVLSTESYPNGTINTPSLKLYTNFGVRSGKIPIYHIAESSALFDLVGPNSLTTTGFYDYSLSYSIPSSQGSELLLELQSISGAGEEVDFVNVPMVQTEPFLFTGSVTDVSGTGTITGMAYIYGTGFYTGTSSEVSGVFERYLERGSFTGNGSHTFDPVLVPNEGIQGVLPFSTYTKTFSGEYNFYTGSSPSSLQPWFPQKYSPELLKYTNSGTDTIIGERSVSIRIHKKKASTPSSDLLRIHYSGEGGGTGFMNIRG